MYDYKKLKYTVFDIEADGITPTKVHCIVTKRVGSNETKKFYEENLLDALKELSESDVIVGHNIIGYDLPVLKELLGFEWDGKVVDTLVMSKVFNPDRQLPVNAPTSTLNPHTGRLDKLTPHSLDTWGYRVGRGKPPYYDWEEFDMDMLHRCEEDVEINELVFFKLLKEGEGNNWLPSLELEYEVARIIHRQEVTGFPFDINLAYEHLKELERILDDLYADIRSYLHMDLVIKTELKKPFKKNGEHCKAVHTWYPGEAEIVGGPFTRIEWEEPGLTKRVKLASQLLELGWKPDLKTEKGQWKLTEKGKPVRTLSEMKLPIGKKLAEYYTYAHRKSQIEGWLEKLRPDGRLTAGADSAGTNTARMKHKIVVNVPKADPSVIFGSQMRQLFIPANGYYLVGWDASGLEARVMAHYTYKFDGGEFARLILEGDVHSHNTHIFFPEETEGMTKADPQFTPFRNLSKNGFYALVYGAQPSKLASTLGIPRKEANSRFDAFWEHNPGLGRLRDRIIRMAEEYGYVPAIDHRRILIRSSHSALNALFQSCGSIIMKKSAVLLVDWADNEGLNYELYANVHDEIQSGVPKREVLEFKDLSEETCLERPYGDQIWTPPHFGKDGEYHTYYARLGELAVHSIREAGVQLGMRVPMDAEYMVGNNWSETH